MRYKVAIVDKDDLYLQRVAKIFGDKYADDIEIFSYSSLDAFGNRDITDGQDIVLYGEGMISADKIPESQKAFYLVTKAGIEKVEGVKAVYKYQNCDRLYEIIAGCCTAPNNKSTIVKEINDDAVLDTLGIGMLKSNQITGLAGLEYLEEDDKPSIRYKISSNSTLQEVFTGKVDRKKFLTVIRNIVSAVDELADYMMDKNLLITDKREIYVDEESYNIEMLYFPVIDGNKKLDLALLIKSLITETEFEQSDGGYVVDLINFLNRQGGFTGAELLEYLDLLIEEKVPQRTISPVYAASYVSEPEPQAYQQEMYPPVHESQREMIPEYNQDPWFGQNAQFGQSFAIQGSQAGTYNMPPAAGTTKKSIFSMFGKKKKATEDIGKTEDFSYLPQSEASTCAETTVLAGQSFSGETLVLCEEAGTVEDIKRPYLIRKSNNQRVDITKDVFRIGKEQTYVDYFVNDNNAISRSHADIVKRGNEYFIVDNNSLNHTYVNGAQIESQIPVPLNDFDTVTFADEAFEYRI